MVMNPMAQTENMTLKKSKRLKQPSLSQPKGPWWPLPKSSYGGV